MKKIFSLLLISISFACLGQTSLPTNDLITISGTDTYSGTHLPDNPLAKGLKYPVIFTNANTGPSTLNLTGSAIALTNSDGTALLAGAIKAGMTAWVFYDIVASKWKLTGGSSSVSLVNGSGTTFNTNKYDLGGTATQNTTISLAPSYNFKLTNGTSNLFNVTPTGEPELGLNAGTSSGSKGTDYLSIGNGANSGSYRIGTGSIAIGSTAKSTENYSISIGQDAGNTAGVDNGVSTSIGLSANGYYNGSTNIGEFSIGIGASSRSIGASSIAIGNESVGQAGADISIGYRAMKGVSASEGGNVVIGYLAGNNSASMLGTNVVIGYQAQAGNENQVVIGNEAGNTSGTRHEGHITIGSTADSGTSDLGEDGITIGNGAKSRNFASIGLGYLADCQEDYAMSVSQIDNLYFQTGWGNAPGTGGAGITMQAGFPIGTNLSANERIFRIAAAQGTGTGTSGDIKLMYSPPVASGSTRQTKVDALTMSGPTGQFTIHTNPVDNNLLTSWLGRNSSSGSLEEITFTNSPSINNVPTFNGTNWTFSTPSSGNVTGTFGSTDYIPKVSGTHDLTQSDMANAFPGQLSIFNASAGTQINGFPFGGSPWVINTATGSGNISGVQINGGDSNGANGNGGPVIIAAGAKNGSGANGPIIFKTASTELSRINNDATISVSGSSVKLKQGYISGAFSTLVGPGSQSTFTVTIGQTMDNNTYVVGATSNQATSAIGHYITNKTTTTFDIVLSSAVIGTIGFEWHVFP